MAASVGSFACYAASGILHGAFTSLMVAMPQYLCMLPTYVNMFTIFSFCNMHDISWGTKEGKWRRPRDDVGACVVCASVDGALEPLGIVVAAPVRSS
jgi:hypothetical protein